MATTTTTFTAVLRYARLRLGAGFMGHALIAPIFGVQSLFFKKNVAPIYGLAQGRIVSISKGSPPPKKR